MVSYPLPFLKKSVQARVKENTIIFGINEIFPYSFFQLLAIIVNDTAPKNLL